MLYLTYEELKQLRMISLVTPSISLYLTYEELKHNELMFFGGLTPFFFFLLYLTYEELKQLLDLSCNSSIRIKRCTLPMRN